MRRQGNSFGLCITRKSGESKVAQHGEAYCLMKYASAKVGRIEWLWNSRDGVTPFTLGSEAALAHADWHEDVFVPNFVPPVGMLIVMNWSDAPQAHREETRERWTKRMDEAEAAGANRARMEAGAPFGLRDFDPCLVVVNEELRLHFAALAAHNPVISAVRTGS